MNAQTLEKPQNTRTNTPTPRPVERIAMNKRPNLNNIAAVLLLRKYGNQAFPGVRDAQIVFWEVDGAPDGRPAQVWLEENKVLTVGTVGGIFEEHEKTTEADQVAEFLGISELPELEKFLKFANASSTKPGIHPWHIASIVKAMHNNGEDPRNVVASAMDSLQAYLSEQVRSYDVVREEFFNGEMIEVKNLNIAVVVSDRPEMNRFARLQGADVFIQRNSKGHTIVFGTDRVCMNRVVYILRYEELQAQGKPIPADLDLSTPETLEEVPEWHMQVYEMHEIVSNGRQEDPDVPRSKLPLEKITQIVIKGLKRRN